MSEVTEIIQQESEFCGDYGVLTNESNELLEAIDSAFEGTVGVGVIYVESFFYAESLGYTNPISKNNWRFIGKEAMGYGAGMSLVYESVENSALYCAGARTGIHALSDIVGDIEVAVIASVAGVWAAAEAGAATGALVGSVVPGAGTVVGALVGTGVAVGTALLLNYFKENFFEVTGISDPPPVY